MTDEEKLKKIKDICVEAFTNGTGNRDRDLMHKAQALCNIYGLFLYDGETVPQIEDKKQISFEDLM